MSDGSAGILVCGVRYRGATGGTRSRASAASDVYKRREEEDDTGVESEYALKEARATEFYALQLCVHDR